MSNATQLAAIAACLLLEVRAVCGQTDDWILLKETGVILNALDFVDSTTGYVCGEQGLALKTTDAGHTWSTLTTSTTAQLLGVHFPVDASTGYMAGYDGKVGKTTDGGQTWAYTFAGGILIGVHFPAGNDIGYAVGWPGIYKTNDGGANWTRQGTPTNAILYHVEFPFDATTGWAVGNSGRIFKRTGTHMVSGTYTGDAVDGRQITGLGFAPDVVIVKGAGTSGRAYIKTSTMAVEGAKPLAHFQSVASHTDRIESLDSDGFTLGSNAATNNSGEVFYWIAFKAEAGELVVGTYPGNATDDRSIAVGFQPDYVIVFGESPRAAMHASSAMPAGKSQQYVGGGWKNNQIQTFEAGGFQIGDDANVNASGETFHYVAWKATAKKMAVGTYTGDGIDDVSITGLGFQPEYVMLRAADSTIDGAHRPESLSGDSTLRFTASAAVGNTIQVLEFDGFQVGSDDVVNKNTVDYYYAAWGGKWDAQTTPNNEILVDIHMRDESTGWVSGNGDTVLKTTDGGTTWTNNPTGTAGDKWGIYFPTASLGYCTSVSGQVFESTDGGVNWTEQTTATTEALWAVQFPEDSVSGFAVGYNSTIIRTRRPQMITGSYTGNGTDDRAITGVGFQPDVVFINGDNEMAICRTSSMAGDGSKQLFTGGDVSLQPNWVQSLDTDGFTVGDDDIVNADGTRYFWAAFEATGELKVDSYAGVGGDDVSITGVGFEPDYLIIMSDGNDLAVHRYPGSADETQPFTNSSGVPYDNMVQLMESDGFQVGGSFAVNENGETYHYVAFKELPLQIDVGSYTGDGWDDTSITGLGFKPEMVLLKAASNEHPVQRTRSMGSRDTTYLFSAWMALPNDIQKFESDGFQVGNSNRVNTLSTTYNWIAVGRDATQPSTTPRVISWTEVEP